MIALSKRTSLLFPEEDLARRPELRESLRQLLKSLHIA